MVKCGIKNIKIITQQPWNVLLIIIIITIMKIQIKKLHKMIVTKIKNMLAFYKPNYPMDEERKSFKTNQTKTNEVINIVKLTTSRKKIKPLMRSYRFVKIEL